MLCMIITVMTVHVLCNCILHFVIVFMHFVFCSHCWLLSLSAFNLDYYTEVLDLSYLLEHLSDDPFFKKYKKLNEALIGVVEDYSLVSFVPLNIQVLYVGHDVWNTHSLFFLPSSLSLSLFSSASTPPFPNLPLPSPLLPTSPSLFLSLFSTLFFVHPSLSLFEDKESVMEVLKAVDKASGYATTQEERNTTAGLMSTAYGADFQFFKYPLTQSCKRYFGIRSNCTGLSFTIII